MMECIEFKYCYKDDNEVKEVKICKKSEGGIHDYEACEAFLDFMNSIGYDENNIFKYFSDNE